MLTTDLNNKEWYLYQGKKACKIKVPGNIKSNHFDLLEFLLNEKDMVRYFHCFKKAFERYTPRLGSEIFNRYFPDVNLQTRTIILKILQQRWEIGLQILESCRMKK